MSERAEKLLERAQRLVDVVRAQARRAFVIEFTGTPKAGKSTTVATLASFFKVAGYRVHVLKERAAACPLPMKGHFFFNTWTTATMLAELLELFETDVDLMIIDRGLFDALVWLDLQTTREQITDQETRVFRDFVLLKRWRALTDTTILMKVDPREAMRRENLNQLVLRPPGGMMNVPALTQFNDALDRTSEEHGDQFGIRTFTSSARSNALSITTKIISDLLPQIEAWADPTIAVVDRELVTALFHERVFIHSTMARSALRSLARNVQWMRRSQAEKSTSKIQLVASAIHVFQNEVVVFERLPTDKKTKDYGRHLIYKNCHIEERLDGRRRRRSAPSLMRRAEDRLQQRIQDDLHLAVPPDFEFLGLSWNGSLKETKHLGMMFRVAILSEDVASHLQDKQFKKSGRSGALKSFRRHQIDLIREFKKYQFEPWSDYIVRNVNLMSAETRAER